MKLTDAEREATKTKTEKKAMPDRVKTALGRGKCIDCDLPWDCVAVGYHVAIPESLNWLCGFCFIKPVVRGLYFDPVAKPVLNRSSLEYRQIQMSKRAERANRAEAVKRARAKRILTKSKRGS